MNNFIKIRGKLFNMDMFIYFEEFEDCSYVHSTESSTTIANYFTSIRMYFTYKNYIEIGNMSIKELQEILNKKKASLLTSPFYFTYQYLPD